MIELNKKKYSILAQIQFEGKTKTRYRPRELKKFIEKVEEFTNPLEKVEAYMLLVCITEGTIVKVEDGKIFLFLSKEMKGEIQPDYTISKNETLYSLVADLI